MSSKRKTCAPTKVVNAVASGSSRPQTRSRTGVGSNTSTSSCSGRSDFTKADHHPSTQFPPPPPPPFAVASDIEEDDCDISETSARQLKIDVTAASSSSVDAVQNVEVDADVDDRDCSDITNFGDDDDRHVTEMDCNGNRGQLLSSQVPLALTSLTTSTPAVEPLMPGVTEGEGDGCPAIEGGRGGQGGEDEVQVMRKMEAVIEAAESLEEKHRRLNEMMAELEAIRDRLLKSSGHHQTTEPTAAVIERETKT